MKKRILMIMSIIALLIMASATIALAEDTGFTAPKNGDTVLLGSTVEANYIMGYTPANGQPCIKIIVEKPNGETEEFEDFDIYSLTATFTADQEGTYKITGQCGQYITIGGIASGVFRAYSDDTLQTVSVKVVKLKQGLVVTQGNASYKILKGLKTVAYVKPAKKTVTSAVIPETVAAYGKTFKVTEISDKAFFQCKKLKKVTVGKNVIKIGKQAFAKTPKLKTITIKTTKLKLGKVGKKAFTGTNAKAVIKVPKKQLKAYTKILKKRGMGKKVKVKAL